MKHLFTLLLFFIFVQAFAQPGKFSQRDIGAISLHGGSILILNTATIALSSPDFFTDDNNHLRLCGGIGLYYSSFFGVEKGYHMTGLLEYYTGKFGNHFEVDMGILVLEPTDYDDAYFYPTTRTSLVHPRIFLGYRYETDETPIFLKLGLGFPEAVQFGFGYRLASRAE
ncbi:MAG: hypothetical protein GC193_10275 [Cryomorphaceae bacterium]|nr:hypothetical protein [Cryomorphaceae bacterium]